MRLPRLYPILDLRILTERRCPSPVAAEAMLEGGAQILQWRSKQALTRAGLEDLEAIAELCRRYSGQLIVNDRLDYAKMIGAGLHVGQDDLAASDARHLLGSHPVLGLSTHNADQLARGAREPVDYLAIGPIFQTSSKASPDPAVGLAQLHEWRGITPLLLVAIGGITRENAPAVLDAGADSVAVISDLYPETSTFESIRHRTREWINLIG